MSIYDSTEILKRYIFGSNTPSNSDYNQHIRPSNAAAASITYDMQNYMSEGGGRYAYPSLFKTIQKIFNSVITDGEYMSLSELNTELEKKNFY